MVTLTDAVWQEIVAHAEATYPEECCGVVIARSGKEEAIRITNIQNLLHARDPETFPRTARTAYSMRYEEVAPLLEEAYRGTVKLVAFYHSHPEHDAYFSAEDRAAAAGWLDDPNYAAAAQVVVSVRDGRVVDAKAFLWNAEHSDFEPVPLVVGQS
ncbi:hypothetical protein HRbin30_00755 [bacterium HR30]|nr:hypothetical protein HRbin30_00755 [bacterium HR30]